MSLSIKSSITVLAALSLTACGSGNDASETPAPPTPTPIEEPQTETPAPTQVTPQPAAEAEGSPEFADLPEPYASADYSRGMRTFRTCSSCHLLEADAGNLLGPNLHGVFSRRAGELDSYDFSKALQEADFEWTAEKLDEWLANPDGFLPGNNMGFAGVRRERDRVAVIAYLLVETDK